MGYIIAAAVFLGLAVGIFVYVSKTYNNLVAFKNQSENGFAQIEVQLKRRYDLIPNLVECVKGYITHESETLEKVIAARNQAASGLAGIAANPANAAAMQSWMGAEGALVGAMGRLSVVMEDYPELKANENVAQLTEELTSTENKISFARQSYNDWVTNFNTYRQSFPTVFFAPSIGFADDLTYVEFDESEDIETAPTVALT